MTRSYAIQLAISKKTAEISFIEYTRGKSNRTTFYGQLSEIIYKIETEDFVVNGINENARKNIILIAQYMTGQ